MDGVRVNAPLLATTTATGDPDVIFEVTVPSNRLHSMRLVAYRDRLAWGDHSVRYDDVVSFAYVISRNRTALAPVHTGYAVILTTPDDELVIEIVASAFSRKTTKHSTELLFESIASLLHEKIGVRLLHHTLDYLCAGQTVRYGNLNLRWSGLEGRKGMRTRTVAWDDIAGAEFVGGKVVVHRYDKDGTKPVFSIPMHEPNAVLLPDLLGMAAARFNSKRQRRAQIVRDVQTFDAERLRLAV